MTDKISLTDRLKDIERHFLDTDDLYRAEVLHRAYKQLEIVAEAADNGNKMILVERARTEAAEQTIKALDFSWEQAKQRWHKAEKRLKALQPYLRHSTPEVHCDYMKHSDYPCTCGLEAKLEDIR